MTGLLATLEVRPVSGNVYNLGESGFDWANIYSQNAVIVVSDERKKTNICPLPWGLDIVRAVDPKSFQFKEGGKKLVTAATKDVPAVYENIPGKRIHAGFIAREFKTALDAAGHGDCAAYVMADPLDPNSSQALRHGEMLPIAWNAIKDLDAIVTAQAAEIAAMKAALHAQ